jgi:transcriptional regulator with XRE-family HTH domain
MKQNKLKQWREQLGLTQQDLADYLGVSRSLVHLAERGERKLPLDAFKLFTQLVSTFEKVKAAPLPVHTSPGSRQKSLQILQQTLTDATWQLGKRQAELTQMEADYTQALSGRQTYQKLQKELAATEPSTARDKHLLWLNIKQKEARKQLERNGSYAQIALKLKIAELQAMVQEAQAWLATLAGEDPNKEAGQSGSQAETPEKLLPVEGK